MSLNTQGSTTQGMLSTPFGTALNSAQPAATPTAPFSSGQPAGQALNNLQAGLLQNTGSPSSHTITTTDAAGNTSSSKIAFGTSNGSGSSTGSTSSAPTTPTGTNPGLLNTTASASAAGAYDAINGAGAYNSYLQKNGTPPPTGSSTTTPATTTTPPAYDSTTGTITDYGKSLQTSQTPQTPYGQAVSNIGTTAATGAANVTNATAATPLETGILGDINNLTQNEATSLGNNAATPQEVGVGTGRAAYLQGIYNNRLSGYDNTLQQAEALQNQVAGGATTAANLTTGAATTQAGATAPQAYGLTTQPYNPTTDTYGGGGTGGAVNRASTAANIGSAGSLTTDINSTTAAQSTADSNFKYLNSIASQGGIPTNVPAINALNQKYSNAVGGSAIISAFQNQLNTFLQNYATITGTTPVDPNSVTLAQLQTFQQTLDAAASNKIAGDEKTLTGLGGTGGSTSGGSTFDGSAWR